MRKFLLALIFVLLATGAGIAFLLWMQMQEEKTVPQIETEIVETKEEVVEEAPATSEEVQGRLELLRQRVELKDLITEADEYAGEKNYMPAIINYQKALKKSPEDASLKKKIADAYYDMNNFKKAYEYYGEIKDYNGFDAEKYIYSLVNYKGVIPATQKDITQEITALELGAEETFYYTNSLNCAFYYEACEQAFEAYFQENGEPTTDKLKKIRSALLNFQNFQSKEGYYKAAYLGTAFYENGFYYIAIKVAERVEKLKSGYRVMLRTAALSAYQIGDYVEAKKYLLSLKKIDSHDAEVSYLLGRVYEKLNEKTLAIAHYTKALNDGHEDTGDIHRRMMIIYFENKEQEKMLESFDKLLALDTDSLAPRDFSLAIYYNILNKDFKTARSYTRSAIKNYEEPAFYAYQAWIELLDKKLSARELDIIEKIVEKAEADKGNPLTLMVRGMLEYYKKNYSRALVHLKKASVLDKRWEYKEEIEFYIQKIEAKNDNKSRKK